MRDSPFRLIVSINLDRHEILVVGGGSAGERKVGTLLASGARVRLISPEATEGLRALAECGEIEWERKFADRSDFRGRSFAVLALPREALDGVLAMAKAEGCAADTCSDGALGDFALCAQFEMDGCFVGVSSGGSDPAKAAAVKRAIIAERRVKACSVSARRTKTILTRSSPLALAQTDECIKALSRLGIDGIRRTVTSHGDRDRKIELAMFGGIGAFVKALEEELLAGTGDFAVHSMKDIPVSPPDGCVIAAVLPRESARDVLITRSGGGLDSLPPGSVVGTSSLRRRAQVRSVRKDLEFAACRGNIETRLARLMSGEVDALILAEAGLLRLGISVKEVVRLPFVTAAGQGAIAIETRAGSPEEEIAREMSHFKTWCETSAERELLRLMGLGCACPIGVSGVMTGEMMSVKAVLYSLQGESLEREACGRVSSECDALALASGLWDEMRDTPLMAEIASLDFKR
ncbi:MAG: hydroxymethylbilane synthase [Synergistaceae bacterium]|jgi:hydroxymethylbilane synthase|nr:hydroxymethylbilane synthase [Synergistaceae bacterium]